MYARGKPCERTAANPLLTHTCSCHRPATPTPPTNLVLLPTLRRPSLATLNPFPTVHTQPLHPHNPPVQVHAIAAGQEGAPQADEDVCPVLQPQYEDGVQRVVPRGGWGWVGVNEAAGAAGATASYVRGQAD
jgi:hypothetical protein